MIPKSTMFYLLLAEPHTILLVVTTGHEYNGATHREASLSDLLIEFRQLSLQNQESHLNQPAVTNKLVALSMARNTLAGVLHQEIVCVQYGSLFCVTVLLVVHLKAVIVGAKK